MGLILDTNALTAIAEGKWVTGCWLISIGVLRRRLSAWQYSFL
jgi:hypothetical protein